ncbi:MAG: glycosyltransferase family 2 protein [Firmicutes bacterium]|nr:glycosyltransferase family 2 protein [Bacillota bacterium]
MVSIIIPAYNQLAYTRQAIASIRAHTPPPYELVLVDNASTDGTLAYFRSLPGAVVVANPVNQGHAGGTNRGIERSRGEVLVLLNNDVLVTAGWLDNLLRALGSAPDVGMVGPVTNYSFAPRQQVEVPYRDLSAMPAWAARYNAGPDCWEETDFLLGFCLVVKRRVVEEVGLLDEARFALGFFDDNDYSWRVRRAGYRLLIARNTFLHHFGSVTLKQQNPAETTRAFTEAARRFRAKVAGAGEDPERV